MTELANCSGVDPLKVALITGVTGQVLIPCIHFVVHHIYRLADSPSRLVSGLRQGPLPKSGTGS